MPNKDTARKTELKEVRGMNTAINKEFSKMSKDDRYRACYLHACLKRVNRDVMTNATLRERFKIEAKNSSMISRLLNETCELGLIKISPDSTSDKNRNYLPYRA